jgi:hypothetical protein
MLFDVGGKAAKKGGIILSARIATRRISATAAAMFQLKTACLKI